MSESHISANPEKPIFGLFGVSMSYYTIIGPSQTQGIGLFLHFGHVGCLRTLGTFNYVEADLISLPQGLESFVLYGREMDEYVLAAFFTFDETKSLGIIEPLDSTGCQTPSPPFLKLEFLNYDFFQLKRIWASSNPYRLESPDLPYEQIKKTTKIRPKFSWIEKLKPTKNLLQLSYHLLRPVTPII
jgi:hypothetical protein